MGTARDRQDTIVIRALSSITAQQAGAIAHAVQRARHGTWTAEITHDYDGYLSVLVESADRQGDDVFYISGTSGNLELSRSSEDDVTSLGAFSEVDVLIAKLNVLMQTETTRDMQFG